MGDEEALAVLTDFLLFTGGLPLAVRNALEYSITILKKKIAMDEVYKPECFFPDILD